MNDRLRGPLALGLALGLTAELVTGSGFEGSINILQPAVTAACPSPSAEALGEVEKLFDEPPATISSQQKGETPEAYRHRITKLEAEYGVTLPDKSLEQQAEILYSDKAPTPAILAKTHDFLQEFGVSLTVAQPGELQLRPDQIPTKKDLVTPTSSYEIMELGQGFIGLPAEFFALSGIKHMVLAKNTGDFAYALTDNEDDTVVVDVGELDQDPTLADHEITHLLDSKECGGPDGASNDPAYAALNAGQDVYAPQNRAQEITYRGKLNDSMGTVINDHFGVSHEKACADREIVNEEMGQVVAFSDYGLTNIVEDKAEVGKNIAFPAEYGEVLDPKMPILRNKFELLMARLYQLSPKVVKFLAATSGRTYTSPSDIIRNC